jgi:hypothetical protein
MQWRIEALVLPSPVEDSSPAALRYLSTLVDSNSRERAMQIRKAFLRTLTLPPKAPPNGKRRSR